MKVLIVDDEVLVRRSLFRAWELAGHKVWEAENGEQALPLWQQIQPDIVFLDVWMPRMTGPQLLEKMRPLDSVFVVLMSAFAGEVDEKNALDLGAKVFLAKPFRDIFEVIQQTEKLYYGTQT